MHAKRLHSFCFFFMKRAIVSDLLGIINKNFSFALAEEWDNVGLQVGDHAASVKRVMIALDPLPDVVELAIASNCQLLLTHHPLIFSPLRQVTSSTTTGRLVLKAAAAGLAVAAMHTNYDIASGGLNDLLAKRLGLESVNPLKVTGHDELLKLVVFVPVTVLEPFRQSMFEYAESVGNYRDCSFSVDGEGTFLPLHGARPATGRVGVLEKTSEARLELIVRRERLSSAIKGLIKAHPYEEPAFDCYPLINRGNDYGLGRIGTLATPVSLAEYSAFVKKQLGCSFLRTVGDLSRAVSRIALCSGSGGTLLRDAVRAGADLLVTGDLKYHEAREAEASGLAMIDAGHFATERIMVSAVQSLLQETASVAGYNLEVVAAEIEQDPFIPVF